MGLHQPPLVWIERPRLAEYTVRNPDLANVMKEKTVLSARVAEKLGRHGVGQLERVPLDPLGMGSGPAVLRLERAGEGDNGVFVGVLEQQPLTALDLDQPAQVVCTEIQVPIRRLAGRRAAPKQCDPHDH